MSAPAYLGPRPARNDTPARRPGRLARAGAWLRDLFAPSVPERPWQKALPPALSIRSISEVPSLDCCPDPKWTIKITDHSDPGETIKASLWLYAASREIARAVSSLRQTAYDAQGNKLGDDHPLQVVLDNPAPQWTQRRWVEATSYHLTLTGTSYVEKVRASSRGQSAAYPDKGVPRQLWTYPASEWTTEVVDGRRKIVSGYRPRQRYQSDPATLPPSEVFRIMYTRPGTVERGLAPTEAAEREVSIDRQAAEWQQVSLQNRGVPDGIFKVKGDGYLGDKQLEEVETRIEERWTDLLRAHQPWVLGQDLEWIDLAKTMVELELIPGRTFSKEAIAVALGVPTVLWSVEGSTYANYETAKGVMWLHTIVPQARLIGDELTAQLAPEYGEGLKVAPDLERVEALLPFERARWELAGQMWSKGVPLSQISERLELGLEPFQGWDVGLVAGGLAPVDAFSPGGDLGPLLGEGEDE